MPLIIHCTACRRMLQLREEDLGKRVRCPSCSQVFVAGPADDEATIAPGHAPDFELSSDAPLDRALLRPAPPHSQTEKNPPPRRASEPSGDTYAVQLDEDALEPSPRSEDSRRGRRRRDSELYDLDDDVQPHRGALILTLGILSIVLACIPLAGWILGGASMSMGSTDDRLMEHRQMDRSGRAMTKAGQVCGIFGVFLSTVMFILNLFLTLSNLRR
jgi:hypothetical protein